LIVRGDHALAMELIDRNPALAAGFFLSEIAAPCSKGSRRVNRRRDDGEETPTRRAPLRPMLTPVRRHVGALGPRLSRALGHSVAKSFDIHARYSLNLEISEQRLYVAFDATPVRRERAGRSRVCESCRCGPAAELKQTSFG
jgi:hypothetical protein